MGISGFFLYKPSCLCCYKPFTEYNAYLCRYWIGYLYLCKELERRTEAFSTICQLDDISLLEEPDGKTVPTDTPEMIVKIS